MNAPSSFGSGLGLKIFWAARDVAPSFAKLVDPLAGARAANSFNTAGLSSAHRRSRSSPRLRVRLKLGSRRTKAPEPVTRTRCGTKCGVSGGTDPYPIEMDCF
jgi:hypothetical protein